MMNACYEQNIQQNYTYSWRPPIQTAERTWTSMNFGLIFPSLDLGKHYWFDADNNERYIFRRFELTNIYSSIKFDARL